MTLRERFEAQVSRAWEDNIQEVLDAPFKIGQMDPDLLYKIEERSKEMGLPKSELLLRLRLGDLVTARLLAKNPGRQNRQEVLQRDYIVEKTNVSFELLSKQNDIRYTHDGYKTRSVDAIINGNVFTTMKLITGVGGAQHAQRSEVKDFFRAATHHFVREGLNGYVAAIVDDTHPRDEEWYLKDVHPEMRDRVMFGDSEKFISLLR